MMKLQPFGRLVWAVAALICCLWLKVAVAAQDEVFYFVIPDRFSNGDPSNDTGGIEGDRSQHGFDPTDSRYFHGGDLKGLQNKLRYLKRMGVTSIWITPPFKNKPLSGNSAAYHGYWALDYTQVDPHWGTNAELRAFVDQAHRYRMKVYFDVVVNHTADVIRFEECHNPDGTLLDGLTHCAYRTLEESETSPYTPFIPAGEESAKAPAWLNDIANYNNQGDSTFEGESSIRGDFFGLDDLDTTNPTVVNGMIEIAKGWITDFDIDGMRVDTVKHVDIGLWQQWVPALKEHAAAQGKADFFIFGEVFDGLPSNLARFTRDAEFPSVLDFGLYYAIKDTVADYQGTDRLAWVFSQDDYFNQADQDARQLMNFVSNHDVGRIGHFIENLGGLSEEEKLARAKLAQSMMFFARGIPVIYYGDEQGFTGDGGDAEGREDMFASQVAQFNDNNLLGTDATTAQENFDTRHPMFLHLKKLAVIGRAYPELQSGVQFVRHSENTPGIFALSRYNPETKRESLVVFNTSTEEQEVSLAAMTDSYGQSWPSITNNGPDVESGMLHLTVPPLSTRVYFSRGTISLPEVLPHVTLPNLAEGQKVNGLVEVAAQLEEGSSAALALHRVHFEVSVDGGEFQSLGIDHTPDFKVYFNTTDYPDGTRLTFKASVDNYSGDANQVEVNVETGVEPGMRVVFRKPEGWGEPNIYWWNAGPQDSVDWPGVPMTHLIEDWYEFQFDPGVTSANLIFNDGNEQTLDQYREGDGCFEGDAWFDECDLPEPGMTVYFLKPDDWGSDINIFWWNAEPQPGVGWPGAPMELIGEGWYRFQFDNNVSAANLIFNDGSNQTLDQYREGDGCFVGEGWLETCEPPVPGIKVYFKRPAGWAESVNIHYWDAAPADNTVWPGLSMVDEGNDWFSYQFPLNVGSANIVFNDGAGEQSINLFRDADGCYVELAWQDSCDIGAAEPGMTVYFRRPLDWNVPNVHYWYEGGGTAWPGEEMDALGDDWFSLQLPEGVTAANLVINDKTDGVNGNQTADLYREGDGCYDLVSESWTDTCATPGYQVFFKKPEGWDNAYAYFWEPMPEPAANVGWPGEAMSSLGEDWFTYQLPNGVQSSNIIFNNAGAPQTTDLYREGDGCYDYETDSWTDSCDYPKPGMTVYFRKPDGWGDNINVYFWEAEGAPGWPGLAMQALGEGWYSYTFAQGTDQANIIFNDGAGNQTDDLLDATGGCFGEFGDFWRKSCVLPDEVEVEIQNRAAHWLSQSQLGWQVADGRASNFRLYYSMEATITVESGAIAGADGYVSLSSLGGLDADILAQNPHLSFLSGYELQDLSQISTMIKGQLVAAALDSAGNLLEATLVQMPRMLDDLYQYDGELGVVYEGGVPSVTVWAPTAQSIELVLYDASGNELSRHAATSQSEGAYTFDGEAEWDRQYFRFDMRVYHPLSNEIEQYEVTDPYSVGLSQNSRFSQFVDVAGDESLKPVGWDALNKALPELQDITLYEGHLRDFSQQDQSVPAEHRGTYLAFTHNGVDGAELSDGMAHLQSLQQAGLSHFHLLPIFDISSVNEDKTSIVNLDDPFSRLCTLSTDDAVQSRCDSAGETPIREVLGDLALADATNAEIQAITTAMGNLDSFNWGYDPFHFNAPEGSYATATDGATRILEFREMVNGLAQINLNIVMDVVYNHTSASGLWDNSVLDRMVPGYYHRLNPITGSVENSTCCDNTATEHKMMERLMVDTLVSWAKHFKIDSFRFDLMGHIPKSSMLVAQEALAALTLESDGVDGGKIYLYGEGWNFGEVANDSRFEQATQFNMAGTGIGTFNDRMRAAVRGGNFTDSGRAQGWTSGNELFPNGYATGGGVNDQADRIRIGLAGNLQNYPFVDNGDGLNTGIGYAGVGYTLDPQESVNYVDKHDNETLWDNTQAKLPDSMGVDDRVRVHMLSNALINFGQGVPFYQMGTDLLRSKSLDRNSYNSGDWFNGLDLSGEDNNWGVGLPPAQDNDSRWSTMADLINNGNIRVTPDHIQTAKSVFQDQLAIRYSSPLFRLGSEDEVIQRLGFHNTGSGQQAGLIAMSLSDGACSGTDLDPNYDGVLVLFNSDDASQSLNLPGFEGMQLHPLQQSGYDAVVKSATVEGTEFSVPAHTAAVFVKPQDDAQGSFPCNPRVAVEAQPGITVYFHNSAEWPEVRIHYWDTAPVLTSTSWPGNTLQSLGDNWFSYQFADGVQSANLIFNNNNNGEQTTNLFRDADGCYDYVSASWTDTCVLPGLKVYFRKPAEWSDDIHVHYWNAGDLPGTDWPGVPATSLGDRWFMFQFPEGVRASNLIFNDANSGTGGQTVDLFRNRNGCYDYDSLTWADSCSVPE